MVEQYKGEEWYEAKIGIFTGFIDLGIEFELQDGGFKKRFDIWRGSDKAMLEKHNEFSQKPILVEHYHVERNNEARVKLRKWQLGNI